MLRLTFSILFLVFSGSLSASQMQITTCMMDTNNSNNPVLYYFPISTTVLQCDYEPQGVYRTLEELYADGWQLIQLISPMMIERSEKQSSYSPPILYLHRDISAAGQTSEQKTRDAAAPISSAKTEGIEENPVDSEAVDTQKTGFFSWFRKNKTSDKTPPASVDSAE